MLKLIGKELVSVVPRLFVSLNNAIEEKSAVYQHGKATKLQQLERLPTNEQ